MLRPFTSCVVVLVATSASRGGGTHPEIGVGRTAAGQLVPHMHFDQPVRLPRSLFQDFTGYATSLIGFESVVLDDPLEDLFVLSPTCSISARLTFADPAGGAVIHNGPVLMVGQSMEFGPPVFDYHPIYNIPSPSATPNESFAFRFVLHDSTGQHADSEEFELLVAAACPADYNLSGTVSVQDIFDYLEAYFAGFIEADFNRAGGVTIQDLFDFLSAYFAVCP